MAQIRQKLRKCPRCGESRRDVFEVSKRILRPFGGRLCGDCLSDEIRYPTSVPVITTEQENK